MKLCENLSIMLGIRNTIMSNLRTEWGIQGHKMYSVEYSSHSHFVRGSFGYWILRSNKSLYSSQIQKIKESRKMWIKREKEESTFYKLDCGPEMFYFQRKAIEMGKNVCLKKVKYYRHFAYSSPFKNIFSS